MLLAFKDKAGVPSFRVLVNPEAHLPAAPPPKQISKISFQYQHYRDILQFLILSL